MLKKHYILIDNTEANESGEKLLLPICPPVRTLMELCGITHFSRSHLSNIYHGKRNANFNIEKVWLTREEDDEEL